jgi:hypothetical protein
MAINALCRPWAAHKNEEILTQFNPICSLLPFRDLRIMTCLNSSARDHKALAPQSALPGFWIRVLLALYVVSRCHQHLQLSPKYALKA